MIADKRAAVIQPAKQNTRTTQVKTASAPKNPVINSIANMIQTAAKKKQNTGYAQAQNTFQLSSNPVEARKQLDTAVKQYQAAKTKTSAEAKKYGISGLTYNQGTDGTKIKHLDYEKNRVEYLVNKDVLTDAEKEEAKQFIKDYSEYANYFTAKDNAISDAENFRLYQMKNNLEQKTNPLAAGSLNFVANTPGVSLLWENLTGKPKNEDGTTNLNSYMGAVEAGEKNNPVAAAVGKTISDVFQLYGAGTAIKGGVTAAKLTPKLMERGFSKTTANAIEKAVVNVGLAGYSTTDEALKPGYDTSNLGTDFARNALLYGVIGGVGDVAGSALNTAVAKSGLTGLQKGLATVSARVGKGLAASTAGVMSTLPTYSKEDMPDAQEITTQIFTLAIFNALDGGEVRNGIAKRVSKPQSEYFKGIKTAEELKAARNALAKKYSPDIGGSNEIMAQINADYDTMLEYMKNNPVTSNVFRDTIQKIKDWISGLKNRAATTPAGQQQSREAIVLLEDTLKSTGQMIPTGTTAATTGSMSRVLGGLSQYPSASEQALKAPKTPADIPAITSMVGEEKANEILEDIPEQNAVAGKDAPGDRKAKPVTGNGTQNDINNFTSIGRGPFMIRSDLVSAQAPLENGGRIGKQQGDIGKGALSTSGAQGTGNPVLDKIRMLLQNGSGITRGSASGYEQNPVLDAIRALTQNHMAQFAKLAGRSSHIPLGQTKTPDGTKTVLENKNAQLDKTAEEREKFAALMKKQGGFWDERQLRVLKTIADGVAEMRGKQAATNNKANKLVQDILSYAADLKAREGNIADRGILGVADRAGQSIIGTEGAGNKAGIPKAKIDEILKTPKYSRPDPKTYLSKEQIAKHATQFKDGVTKISIQAPSGYAGPPGGTFVMPTSVADDLIARAGGDISELERLLGLDPGDLGTNPVRIDIANPTGLRVPSGNEKGANPKWIPGGYTSGGIAEIIIDSPGPGQYTVRPIK